MDWLGQARALLQDLMIDRPPMPPEEEATLLKQVTALPTSQVLAGLEAELTADEVRHRLRLRLTNLLDHRFMTPLQYQELRQRLIYKAFQYLHDWSLAEEAVQDTFESMIRKVQQFRGDSSYSTWAHKILFYRIVSRRSHPEVFLADLAVVDAEGEGADAMLHLLKMLHEQSATDEEILNSREKLGKVWRLAQVILTDRYSLAALNLLFLQGRSSEETAGLLNIRPEHLHKIVSVARQKLRNSSRIRAIMEDEDE